MGFLIPEFCLTFAQTVEQPSSSMKMVNTHEIGEDEFETKSVTTKWKTKKKNKKQNKTDFD